VQIDSPRLDDTRELVALARSSRATHRRWVTPPATAPAVRAFIARNDGDNRDILLVRRRADGQIIGLFDLSQIFRGGFQNAYLGYWAGAAHEGQGYMSEGLQLILRHTFRTLRLHRLEANIQPGNERSIALVARAGFRQEGVSPRYLKVRGRWRDHLRWAITREDWLNSRPSRRERGAPPPSAD
jgi:[ribosomal protein S5]-alanine N-acetyltransferase